MPHSDRSFGLVPREHASQAAHQFKFVGRADALLTTVRAPFVRFNVNSDGEVSDPSRDPRQADYHANRLYAFDPSTGVPRNEPSVVRAESSSIRLARAKSMMCGTSRASSMMLSGLISRWTMHSS